MNTLNAKIALVTGATRGLGRAIAQSLAQAGARVVINYSRSSLEAEAVATQITSNHGQAIVEQANVCDAASVQDMMNRIHQRWGTVEIVVNNATGPQPMKALEDYDWEDFQSQIDFFVKAPVLLMKEVLPTMKQAHWGRVIHIGSEVVRLGNANFSAYVAAKAAMLGLTRSWAREFGPYGITVNCVEPGWIPVERHANVPAQELDDYRLHVPMQRHGVPEDIGNAVAFLAGEQSNFITGQCLAVNGGNTF